MEMPWPHGPAHQVLATGVVMVTSGTYRKEHFFRGQERLDLLQQRLLSVTGQFGWQLLAWALFSNHYHVVMVSPEADGKLPEVMRRLHGSTSNLANKLDRCSGRKVWHEYWDRNLTYEKSYLARLNYVIGNPVKHGLVKDACDYPWCSAGWFSRTAPTSFRKTVLAMPCESVNEHDDFDPVS